MKLSKPVRLKSDSNKNAVKALPCAACGEPAPSDPAHIKSVGSGGSDHLHNMLPLCRKHHRLQHDKGWFELLQIWPTVLDALDGKGWQINESTRKLERLR